MLFERSAAIGTMGHPQGITDQAAVFTPPDIAAVDAAELFGLAFLYLGDWLAAVEAEGIDRFAVCLLLI